MPATLPGAITIPTRDELVSRWKLDYLNRVPDADLDDPQLEVDASVNADALLPLYANQRVIGSNAVLEDATGDALTQWGLRELGPDGNKLAASGSSGFVVIDASVGGCTIEDGRELVNQTTSLKYQAVITGGGSRHFDNGELCPVIAKDVGPLTNVAGGVALAWSSAPSGSGPSALVATAGDGSGLSGGREDETEAEYRERIRTEKADRSKSGNDADYRRTVTATPGIRVQQVFTWPAIAGTGTTAYAATLAPAFPGGPRVCNEAQRGLIEAYVDGKMPVDDGAFAAALSEQSVDVTYILKWAPNAAGWADIDPWPKYYPPTTLINLGAAVISSATDSTHFVINMTGGIYIIDPPTPGKSIALFRQPTATAKGTFLRKRILSVSGSGPWTIVIDGASSDTSYVPQSGQRVMPWSDSLEALLDGLLPFFDTIGPGEMSLDLYDQGTRQRRHPLPPLEWPNVLTSRDLENAIDAPEVLDRSVVEGQNTITQVGAMGILAYLMRLRWVAAFPLT